MDSTQNFKPQTLYDLLSRACPILPDLYDDDALKSMKAFSNYERVTGKVPDRVLHAVVMQPDIVPKLDIAARDRTSKIKLEPSDPHYEQFVCSIDQRLKWEYGFFSPIVYSEGDIHTITGSMHYRPAISAINIIKKFENTNTIDLSLARSNLNDRTIWVSSVVQRKDSVIPDGALYEKEKEDETQQEQETLVVGHEVEDPKSDWDSDLNSGSRTDVLETRIQQLRLDQEQPPAPKRKTVKGAVRCTIELKSNVILQNIKLENALDITEENPRNDIATPFLYTTDGNNAAKNLNKTIIQVYNQMLAYGVDYAILSSFHTTYFVHRRSIEGFNTLIFSSGSNSTVLCPAHYLSWFLQTLDPDSSSHLFDDPDMSCIRSWFEFYRKMNTQNDSLLSVEGLLSGELEHFKEKQGKVDWYDYYSRESDISSDLSIDERKGSRREIDGDYMFGPDSINLRSPVVTRSKSRATNEAPL